MTESIIQELFEILPTAPADLNGLQWSYLRRVMQGKDNGAIAREMGVSCETVKYHLKVLRELTNTQSRYQLALWGVGARLLRSVVETDDKECNR